MAITREKKKAMLEKISSALKTSESMVFAHFKGLTVADTTAMREDLRGKGVKYTVAKKTLVRRALSQAQLGGEAPALEGELALAYAQEGEKDPIAPARSIKEFEKKYDGKVSILGGIFQGVYKSRNEMREIAGIPSMEQLRGMFANIINSPIQRFAIVLGQVATKK